MAVVADYRHVISAMIDKKLKPVKKRMRKYMWTHGKYRKR